MDTPELKTNFSHHKTIFLVRFFFYITLKIYISSMVNAFDLISKLTVRSKYQLSSGTEISHITLLYLVWMRFLSQSTNLDYAQPW